MQDRNSIKRIYRLLKGLLIIAPVVFVACSKSSEEDPQPNPSVQPKMLTVDPATMYQTIAGFGGANQMWGTQFPSATDIKKAFGTDDGELGLSIFRIRIPSNPDEWPLIVDVTKEARKYGAKILASPWSPPPALKSNGSDIGGFLLEENYEAFAGHLNAFVEYMISNGAAVDAISIQNEPDIQVDYESCDWSESQMRAFLKSQGPNISGVKMAAPESFNFNQAYTNAFLNDADAAEQLDIIAGHIYGGGLAPFPLAAQKNKEVWMTEYLLNQNATANWSSLSGEVIWDETLQMLNTMHQSMTHGWNAYIWWYLKRYYSFLGDGSQGTTSGEVLKRGYAFSHFSKFVRPGYIRVKADFQHANALASAYQGPNETVIVVINPGTTPVNNIGIKLGNEVPTSATFCVTNLTVNQQISEAEFKDGNLLVSVPAKSVATVVVEN
ncbi:MAG TPA: hypothetical protein VKZ68_07340 [Ohtaekwangia sp.]|nr:hypothetical protein [Ohtaekwangia sp.]